MSSNIITGIFSPQIEIKQVQSLNKLKDFIFLPWKIYKAYPFWSPALVSKEFRRLSKRQNPFFLHSDAAFFVAYQEGKPVGRIAAIMNNRHEAFHHDGVGFFGFFETTDDYRVAKQLLMAAEKWCKERGKRSLVGPVNLSIHDEYGLLIEGFQQNPYIFMPYNPPYYSAFLERLGFQKYKDMFAYQVDIQQHKDSISRLETTLASEDPIPNLTFRDLRGAHPKETLKRVFQAVFNPEWQQQYGFLPLTVEEMNFRIKEYAKWIIPELILIGEVNATPVSCMILLPNFNEVTYRFNGPFSFLNNLLLSYYKHQIHTARCVLLLVRRHLRSHDIHLKMIQEAVRRFKKLGINAMELGWISEDHIATRHAIESFGLKPIKQYRLFTKDIPQEHLFTFSATQEHHPLPS